MKIRNFGDVKTILFNNLTVKQTIFKNTFWIALANGISRLLKLILIIYAARILGVNEYGKFTFALAFIALFVIFQNFGLSGIVTREFAREKESKKEFSSILSLKILLGFLATILILVSSFFVTPDSDVRKVIWILAFFSLISNFSIIIHAFFRARQKMEYQSWGVILEALVVFGVGLFVLLNLPSIVNLSYGYLISALIGLIFTLFIFHLRIFPLRISWDKSVWRKFLIMSWPLALTGLFSTIYGFIDSVMMGYLGQITETGLYNAAYKIVFIFMLPAGIIATSFYPVLSKFFKESKRDFQATFDYYLKIMILLAFPLVSGGMIVAPKIINFVYGPEFSASVLALQILMIMAGAFFFYKALISALVVSNQQDKVLWITLLGASINVILNLILIPKFSLYGAAGAIAITYCLILFLLFIFVSKFTPLQPFNLKLSSNLATVSFSSMVMCLVISRPLIYNLNLFFSVLIGIIIYLSFIFFFRRFLRIQYF